MHIRSDWIMSDVATVYPAIPSETRCRRFSLAEVWFYFAGRDCFECDVVHF